MKYVIYNNIEDFNTKNDEIIESGICGNAVKYADLDACKHPKKDLWAMPVLDYATDFFNDNELIELTSDWLITLK